MTKRNTLITRRTAIASIGALIASPAVLRAKTMTSVKLSLPWLAQGATAFAYVGKTMGAYEKYGLDVQVSRGYGSLPTAQAVGQKQFDFGIVSAGPTILAAARGAGLAPLATINYDTTMGILVREDSPIQSPEQLTGKKLGAVVTSAEFPFWPAYASNAGIDASKVEIVQMDNRVLERTLIDRNVDAITCIGASSIPVVAAQGVKHRFFPFRKHKLALYSNLLVTNTAMITEKPDVCKDMTVSLLEALAYQLREPEKSIDILVKEVPEIGMTSGGVDNANLSQGILQSTILAPEAIENGLGWTSPDRWKDTVALTMKYAVPPNTPEPDLSLLPKNNSTYPKLTSAEWDKLKSSLAPFEKMLG
jgi:ABC-type nitrate/sulfonate/bicarbonate transport system substrate-binding protein